MRIEPIIKELEEVKIRLSKLQDSLKEFDDTANKYRQQLIMKSTQSEKVIKVKLKSLKIDFEFQKIIKNNKAFRIVDFYLPKYNLIIEVDGFYHSDNEQRGKDLIRTNQLADLGYDKILRLDNIKAKNITEADLLKLIKLAKPIRKSTNNKLQKIIKYKQRIEQLEKLVRDLSK